MLKVIVEDTSRPLEQVVDADLKEFDTWMQSRLRAPEDKEPPQPLVNSERAILKLYLWWKTKGATDAKGSG